VLVSDGGQAVVSGTSKWLNRDHHRSASQYMLVRGKKYLTMSDYSFSFNVFF
jgi:hypothetical protein